MYDFIHYQVRDVMTTNPVAIGADHSLTEIEKIFAVHDFNGLPVVDANGALIGLVTKLDLLKAFIFSTVNKVPPYEAIMERPASRVMRTDPQTVQPDTPLTRVLTLMTETRFKSLPVLENGLLVGMVSREDILKALRLAAQGIKPSRITPQS